jgi:hypothetical protein
MANYYAKNPKELAKALAAIRKKSDVMVRGIQTNLGRVTLNAAQIVEARAKEIITEKGHIVTGTLRRSINSQLEEVTYSVARANVGTFIEYGPAIENLPDGGFLFPALEETAPEVSAYLYAKGVKPHLEGWAK